MNKEEKKVEIQIYPHTNRQTRGDTRKKGREQGE